jgi:GNAT superfamily N-acetyltransferase
MDSLRAYRAGRRLVRMLPPWLVRFRPFRVYEIPLSGGRRPPDDHATAPRPGRGQTECDVRWASRPAEAQPLSPVASPENLAGLNFTSRRVAAAWRAGQAIGCAWVATEAFEERELGLRFELAADEAWLFAAVVDASWRNQGVYRQLLEFVVRELRAGGMRRLLL